MLDRQIALTGLTTSPDDESGAGMSSVPSHWLTDPDPVEKVTDIPTAPYLGGMQVTMTGPDSFDIAVTRSVLVIGSGGGAGTTAVTIGLSAAIAADNDQAFPVAVDATPAGGNLGVRAADMVAPVSSMQAWLSAPQPGLASTVDRVCGRSTGGVSVLTRHEGGLPRRETTSTVHRHLTDAGATAVYDGGGRIQSRFIRPLLSDSRIPIALVVEASPGSVNQLTPVLGWLDDEFGEYLVADIAVVVVHRYPLGFDDAAPHLRKHLGKWVRGVYEIPYDDHIAEGGPIKWDRLHDSSHDAYRNLVQEFTS